MPSGAGLNTVGNLGGVPLLTISPTDGAVTAGTYGRNSGAPASTRQATFGNDSGVQMLMASGFTKWTFCIVGPGSLGVDSAAYSVSIYGTIDPELERYAGQNAATHISQHNGIDPSLNGRLDVIPATSWFLLPAPSDDPDAGSVTNPLATTATGPTILNCSLPLVAVRAVLTTAPTTATDSITVLGFAVP